VLDQLGLGGVCAQLDERVRDLVEPVVGAADDRGHLDRRMRHQRRLDLRRSDVLPAHAQHLLLAPAERDPAVHARSEIAGVEPPVGERRGVHVVVAVEQQRTSQQDLAVLGQPHLEAFDRPAGRLHAHRLGVVDAGDDRAARALGHAEGGDELGRGHRRLQPPQRVGLADREHGLQAGQIDLAEAGMVDDAEHDPVVGRIPDAGPLAREQVDALVGREEAGGDVGRAGDDA
jgi:hypothetical protein